MIVSSFLSQYGLRLSTRDFMSVGWGEFKSLLAGISPDTVLGRVVAIRSETDENILKNYSEAQKKIYDDWHSKQAKTMTEEKFSKEMADLERMFAAICG